MDKFGIAARKAGWSPKKHVQLDSPPEPSARKPSGKPGNTPGTSPPPRLPASLPSSTSLPSPLRLAFPHSQRTLIGPRSNT
eukprot:363284-Chlamydomonas_euryale.AAC.5